MMDDEDNYCDLSTKAHPKPQLDTRMGAYNTHPHSHTLAFSAGFVGEEGSFQDACV